MGADPHAREYRSGWLAPVALLVLTAAVLLLWSRVKLFWVDELLVLDTDSVRTAREVLHIQRRFPISLDPAVYHLLSHWCTVLFGPTRFALRLPSLFGFLLMQGTLYLFTRRIAGARAAVFALAFPALSGALYYGAEGRPYGLLLGIFGVTMLAYQRATHAESGRLLPLTGVALGLGLAENTHYFGIMLFLPVCGAELVRIVQRRRLDWGVVMAIAAGATCEVFTLPFHAALARYRDHYYNVGAVDPHALVRSYRLLLLNFQFSSAVERLSSVGLLAFLVLIVAGTLRARRRLALPAAELALVLLMAALPFAGYLLAKFATHTMEVRYVLGGVLGVAVLFALAVAPMLDRLRTYRVVLAVVAVVILCVGAARIHMETVETARIRAMVQVTPQQKAMLLSGSDGHIYMQNEGSFQICAYYCTDPEIRARLVMLYSFPEELRYFQRDTNSLTADHMQHFTGFRIEPWEQFRQQPGDLRLVQFRTGWDWSDRALEAEGATTQPMGDALGGDATAVRFPHAALPVSAARP
jgi:4-amino-4-deoxy-L-arabinose transferase-like glycosyltransferase